MHWLDCIGRSKNNESKLREGKHVSVEGLQGPTLTSKQCVPSPVSDTLPGRKTFGQGIRADEAVLRHARRRRVHVPL